MGGERFRELKMEVDEMEMGVNVGRLHNAGKEIVKLHRDMNNNNKMYRKCTVPVLCTCITRRTQVAGLHYSLCMHNSPLAAAN